MNLSEKYPDWEQAITAHSEEVEWSPELLEAVRKVSLVLLECDDSGVSFEQALVEIDKMHRDGEQVCLSSRSGRPAARLGGANWSMSVTDIRYLAGINDLARLTDEEIGEALRARQQHVYDRMEDHFQDLAGDVVDFALSSKSSEPVAVGAEADEQL